MPQSNRFATPQTQSVQTGATNAAGGVVVQNVLPNTSGPLQNYFQQQQQSQQQSQTMGKLIMNLTLTFAKITILLYEQHYRIKNLKCRKRRRKPNYLELICCDQESKV